MAAKSSVVGLLFLCLLVCSINPSLGQYGGQQKHDQRVREARECRIQRLSTSRPSRRIESEGGVTELWNEEDEQFQCAGVAAMRNIIQPDSLSLPNFSPSPRLVYIERGQGLLGISIPGCVEAFHSRGRSQSPKETIRGAHGLGDESIRDQHQKVHRIRQGDIVALPAGVAHWSYNDGNEELIAFSVSDLNSETNQLDQRLRSFYLAGGQPREEFSGEQTREQGRETFGQSIIRGFYSNVIADAFNIPTDLARKIQREDNRGLIVRVQKGGMSVITPDEEDEEEEGSYGRRGPAAAAVANRLEESYCTVRLTKNINNVDEADVYSRQAGRLYTVNRNKLPVLGLIGMSAEKGSLYPNAIFAPQWSMNAHVIKYITRGEGRIQVVGQSGKTMLDVTVKPGDVVVVPQYFASVKKAGNNGLEWVSFKTSSLPMRTPLAGASSAFMGFPLQVLANAYQISNREARDLKYNREDHFVVLPPSSSSSSSRPTTTA